MGSLEHLYCDECGREEHCECCCCPKENRLRAELAQMKDLFTQADRRARFVESDLARVTTERDEAQERCVDYLMTIETLKTELSGARREAQEHRKGLDIAEAELRKLDEVRREIVAYVKALDRNVAAQAQSFRNRAEAEEALTAAEDRIRALAAKESTDG